MHAKTRPCMNYNGWHALNEEEVPPPAVSKSNKSPETVNTGIRQLVSGVVYANVYAGNVRYSNAGSVLKFLYFISETEQTLCL